MNIKTIILGTAAALALTSSGAAAQAAATPPLRETSRITLGVSGLGAAPQGGFADQLDHAFGAGADVRVRLDGKGRLALRFDGEALNRGWGGRDVEVPSPVGGMRTLALNTSSTVVLLEMGPEFTGSFRGTRPYVGVGAGAAWFVTDASGYVREGQFGVTTTVWQQDAAFVWGARAGMRLPLRGRTDMDLGVEYHHGAQADFVRKGDLSVDELGSIAIRPISTNADMLVFRAGVSVALGRKRTAAVR